MSPKQQNAKIILNNQRGQGLIEYLILVALIGVASIVAVKTLNQSVTTQMSQISKSLGADVQSDIGKARVLESDWKKKDFKNFMGGSLNRGNSGGADSQDRE